MHRIPTRPVRAAAALLTLGLGATLAAPANPANAAPRRADLAVTVTADQTEISTVGGRADVTIDVRNVGTGTANGATVAISRPDGTGYSGWGENPSPPGWNCDFGTEWTCTTEPLAVGAVAEPLLLRLSLPAGQAGETAMVGAVATTSSQEPLLDNNSGQVALRYVAPDLAISMTAKPTQVIVGGQVTYWIDVRNLGAATDGVKVELFVPAGMRGVSYSGPYGWGCSLGTDTVTNIQSYLCLHNAVPAGGSAEPLTLTLQVENAAAGDTLTATSTAADESGAEQVTTNNRATAPITVVEAGHLSGAIWGDGDRDGIRDDFDSGSYMLAEWVTILPQDPADGDPQEIPVSLPYDGDYRVALKPGRYVLEVAVDKGELKDFSPPNVGDDATDSDVIATEDTNSYYRIARSAVVEVTAGGETVVDAGVVSP
ncbi:hypothetical protein [Micromonospora sp. DT47]|uniref:hypothetical protein n=1 Tax=Micromonospora sp. DT47 TaxID=3393431 RepID=UPI003CED62BB